MKKFVTPPVRSWNTHANLMEFDGCIALGILCDCFPARGNAEYYFLSHAHTEYVVRACNHNR